MASTPITIAVKSVQCMEETADVSESDEIYVISVAVDLRKTNGIVLSPKVRVVVTGVWTGVDEGDVAHTTPLPPDFPEGIEPVPWIWRKRCWGFGGKPAFIDNPGDVIILSALMEKDFFSFNTDPKGTQVGMTQGLGKLLPLFNNGTINRPQLKAKLLALFEEVMALGEIGYLFFVGGDDDHVGPAQALELTPADLDAARNGTTVKSLRFQGDDGDYWVYYELSH